MPNPEDITDPTTTMNMAFALMAKAFKLNYSTPTNNNHRISSNPRNRQIAQPGMNMGQDKQMQMVGGNGRNKFRQYAGQNVGNLVGYNDVIGNQNLIGNGNLVAARAERNAAGQNGNQIRCYNCRGVAADLDEIEEVNANCILMANLQQALTSGTQTDSAPIYDTDGSAEVHENYDDNEIFNMFTQEEQYTELLEPIPESYQVPQTDNDVISEDTSVEQGGETVEPKEKSTVSFLLEEKKKLNTSSRSIIIQSRMQGIQLGNGNQNPIGNSNLVVAHAKGNAAGQNGNQIRCYNCRGVGHYAKNCTVRPRRRDAAYLQTQLLIAQKEEAGIQLQAEEYDLMAAAADLDKIEEVNANCILMANLQRESTSGTQTDSAPVYDTDRSAEDTSVEQGGETIEQHSANFEETRALYESLYQNLSIEVEKVNSVNRKLKETNEDMTTELARYKNQERSFEISQEKYDKLERCYQQSVYQEQCLSKKINALHLSSDELLDKQIQLEKKIKELNNILLKRGQSIQTIHMLSPKPDSFYHTEQKMALGYQNPFYLKQAQKKQQSLYDGKVLLEKHDPPVVHDSEETLQLAQESRVKMKQMNKEIKPANYNKINHISGVFVPQKALSREELYFSNNSKMANVSKSFLIPNEDLSDDTTPSVTRKFLNEEAAKFVGDFKSLANEADASLAKHKALELEIKCRLKAIVSQYIMIIVQNESVIDTSDLQTELERTKERFENCIIKKETEYAKLWNDWYKKCDECKYDKISYDKAYKDMQQKIEWLQAQLGDLKGKSKDTSSVSDTRNPLSQKLKNENVELEFQDTSKNTKFAKQPIVEHLPKIGKTTALSKPVTSNSVSTPQESKSVNNDKVIAPGMFRINPSKTFREENHVTNTVNASARTKPITVSQPHVITKKDVNSDLNDLSSTGVDNTKTRRSQPRSNTKNDRVPSASKSSRSKNKEAEVEEHHRNLLFSKINKHISSACLPKFKFHKEHLCPSCEQGKRKRASHPPKPVSNSRQRLHLLHIDLCGPMRIANINGKRITALLQSPIIIIRTNNGTEFNNQVLKEYFDTVGISHQMSIVRTPQQNRVVER
nr:hypothetical protein [Tanacetum cinerariifolium]